MAVSEAGERILLVALGDEVLSYRAAREWGETVDYDGTPHRVTRIEERPRESHRAAPAWVAWGRPVHAGHAPGS